MKKRIALGTAVFLAVLSFSVYAAVLAEGSVKVSGTAWYDGDADGVMGGREETRAGVRITIQYREGESITDGETYVTEKDGRYSFTVSTGSEYRLMIEAANAGFSVPGKDNAALPASGTVSYTRWNTADKKTEMNIGLVKNKGFIGVTAFADENKNGGRGGSEPLIDKVKITLIYKEDAAEYEIAVLETTNNKNDYAAFRNVTPGTYFLRAEIPETFTTGPLGTRNTQFNNRFGTCVNGFADSVELEVERTGSVGMALGLIPAAEIHGYVRNEAGNGVSGAGLRLTCGDQEAFSTAVTDENGFYSFDHISSESAELSMLAPEGMMFAGTGSLMTASDTAKDSVLIRCVQGKKTELDTIVLVKENTLTVCVYESAFEKDANGTITENGERTALSVPVTLYGADGSVIGYTEAENGKARFRALREGTVYAWIGYAAEDVACLINGDKAEVLESDAPVMLDVKGDSNCSVIVTGGVFLSGTVYTEKDNNGVRSAEESVLPEAAVQAVDTAGNVCAETLTGADGQYVLGPLVPAAYKVRVALASPYIAADPGADNALCEQTFETADTETIILKTGERREGVTLALYKAGVICGTVKMDDGFSEEDLGGLEGVKVTLTDTEGNAVSSYSYDYTDKDGAFRLNGVRPGTYRVLYTLPDNCRYISPESDERDRLSDEVTVTGAEEIGLDPVAAVACCSFSGTVMHSGEAVAAQIRLYGVRMDSLYYAETEEDGTFTVSGFRPDTYTVSVILDEKYVFGDGTDSAIGRQNATEASFEKTFVPGEEVAGFAVEAALTGTVNGYVFMDNAINGNSADPLNTPEAGTQITLVWNNRVVKTAVSDENGVFVFENVIPGSNYSVKVGLDGDAAVTTAESDIIPVEIKDGDTDIRLNVGIVCYASVYGAVRDMGGSTEPVSGLTVTILREDGTVAGTAETDTNGDYAFTGLLPGTYELNCALPEGFDFADKADEKGGYSSLILKGGVKVPFSLAMGENMNGADIAIGAPGKIGDFCWLDENANGLIDIGERQLPGIRITLFRYGEPVAETVSDEYGFWELTGLYPGKYTVRADMPDEVQSTRHRDDFPLINSILPEYVKGTAETEITVPSAARDLGCDMGFMLIREGVYPAVLDTLPSVDWSFGGKKTYPDY